MSELREQGRGFVGALFAIGVTFLYTMESWQLAKTLPMSHLLAYTIVGIGGIVILTHSVGFRDDDRIASSESSPTLALAVESAEILFQSFLATYVGLFLLGNLTLDDSLGTAVRFGLLEVVPLGFGAALTNELVRPDENGQYESYLPHNVAVFTLGALFIGATIAPTQELTVIAARIGWFRTVGVAVLSIAVIYLTLFELEFRGEQGRLARSRRAQVGTSLTAYAIGAVVSVGLLTAYGHFVEASFPVVVQKTILLAFPASLGAAGAEVVV